MQAVVLDRYDVDASVRQTRRIGLLPLRADRVVNAKPFMALASWQFEVVAALVNQHAAEEASGGISEFVVLGKVTDDVFGGIVPEHLCHASLGPGVRHFLVATGAGLAARIRARSVRDRL